MPFINLPPVISEVFWELENRVRRLETAYRFNAPNVDFATATPTNPRVADIFYDTDADLLKYWNGTEWIQIADSNISPTTYTVNATLKTTNNNIVYTGNPCQVEYQRVGNMITANARITGTTVSNWGTGQLYFTLPAGFPATAHDLAAGGFLLDNGNYYTIFATLLAGATDMYLWHPTSNGGSDIMDYNSPAVLDSTSVLNITGVALLV